MLAWFWEGIYTDIPPSLRPWYTCSLSWIKRKLSALSCVLNSYIQSTGHKTTKKTNYTRESRTTGVNVDSTCQSWAIKHWAIARRTRVSAERLYCLCRGRIWRELGMGQVVVLTRYFGRCVTDGNGSSQAMWDHQHASLDWTAAARDANTSPPSETIWQLITSSHSLFSSRDLRRASSLQLLTKTCLFFYI